MRLVCCVSLELCFSGYTFPNVEILERRDDFSLGALWPGLYNVHDKDSSVSVWQLIVRISCRWYDSDLFLQCQNALFLITVKA